MTASRDGSSCRPPLPPLSSRRGDERPGGGLRSAPLMGKRNDQLPRVLQRIMNGLDLGLISCWVLVAGVVQVVEVPAGVLEIGNYRNCLLEISLTEILDGVSNPLVDLQAPHQFSNRLLPPRGGLLQPIDCRKISPPLRPETGLSENVAQVLFFSTNQPFSDAEPGSNYCSCHGADRSEESQPRKTRERFWRHCDQPAPYAPSRNGKQDSYSIDPVHPPLLRLSRRNLNAKLKIQT